MKRPNLNSRSPRYPLLTAYQENFYRLHKDLQEAFDSRTDEHWINKYLDWWEGYFRPTSFDAQFLTGEKKSDIVNLVGFAKGDLGLGEDIRLTSKALDLVGIKSSVFSIDYPVPSRNSNMELMNKISLTLPGRVSIFNLPPTEIYRLIYSHGAEFFSQTYNIAYAPWELDAWASELAFCFDFIDEVWGISEYTTECFSKSLKCPVYHMPLSIDVPEISDVDIFEKYSIPKNKFAFLLMFDLNSSIHRKNPYAAYEAFSSAFPSDENVILIVKTMGEPTEPKEKIFFEKLRKDPRVFIVFDTLAKSEVNALISQVDCYVSLHRAEGFGRIMAEAMLLGTSVIATKYSGNLDFMNDSNSYLVDYNLIKIDPSEYHYVYDNYWADPIVRSASKYMREVFCDFEASRRKSVAAVETIEKFFSNQSNGERMLNRLQATQGMLG